MAGRGDILAWGAENIQITLFTSVPHQFSATTLFVGAFDSEPAASNEANHPQLGRHGSASSPVAGQMLTTLQLQAGRCDIILHASGEELAINSFPAKVTDIPERVDYLVTAMKRVLEKFTQVTRVALNCRLVQHFDTIDQANATLSKVLPVAMKLDKGERDFSLQYNLRGSANGFGINRLLRWAVEPVQVIGGVTPDFTQQAVLREFWASVVHLDFNTVIPRPIFKNEEIPAAIEGLRDSFMQARKSNLVLD